MNESMKHIVWAALLLILGLFPVTQVLARRDELIQYDVEARIAESRMLRGARIEVRVKRWLVVLTGEVRLYEQSLIAERIAWTTPGVFEVDNEIRVVPKFVLSDAAIERKIREIVKADERYRKAALVVRVSNGVVFIKGSFLGFTDSSILKHKIAEIEGVVAIEMNVAFIARCSEPRNGAGVNPQRG